MNFLTQVKNFLTLGEMVRKRKERMWYCSVTSQNRSRTDCQVTEKQIKNKNSA